MVASTPRSCAIPSRFASKAQRQRGFAQGAWRSALAQGGEARS
jgi:hypothetical protein